MRALVLAIGQFGAQWLDKTLSDELRRAYRYHPDGGLHSAVEWALRNRFRMSAALKTDDEFLRGLGVAHTKDHRWYVNSAGMTMVVLPIATKFRMGSHHTDRERERDEMEHDEAIKNPLDISTKEVTIRQYLEFLVDPVNADLLPKKKDGRRDVRITPNDWLEEIRRREPSGNLDMDQPVTGVTWYEATRYCNWLSRREKIPEYYPPPVQAKSELEGSEQPLYQETRKVKTGQGYRLPAEKEWEYACRAGSTTPRPFGRSIELLEHYGWSARNSKGAANSVGQLMPNDWGMFDMLGNAFEWTQDLYNKDYQVPNLDEVSTNPYRDRVLRGGSFESSETNLRSAYRDRNSPSENPDASSGFRVARTR